MPKLSRRKQSKPQHLSSDDEETTASPQKGTKGLIADDNGNIITTRSRTKTNKQSSAKPHSPIKSERRSPRTNHLSEEVSDRENDAEDQKVTIESSQGATDVRNSLAEESEACKASVNGIQSEADVDRSIESIDNQREEMVVSDNGDHLDCSHSDREAINNKVNHYVAHDNQEEELSDGASIDPESDDDTRNEDGSITDRSDCVDGDTKDDYISDNNSGIPGTERGRDLYNAQEQNKKCDFCGVMKRSPADLRRHMTKHTGERPFVCLLCSRAFKAKRSLQYHQFSFHGIDYKNISERYPDIRKRKLEAGELMDDSIITELEQKRMKLEDDIERETVSPVLNEVGEPGKRRVCEICNKVCVKPSDLKRHMMSHTGERPFKCEVCGKPFRAKNSMMYHLKSSHGYNIELSPGLEERFMRLKKQTRLCPVTSAVEDSDVIDTGVSNLNSSCKSFTKNLATTNRGSVVSVSGMNFALDPTPRFQNVGNHEKKMFYSCDLNSFADGEAELDESSGLFKRKDFGLEIPDHEVFKPSQQMSDLPSDLVKPGGNLVTKDIILESVTARQDLTVKSETVLVTRLDGILTNGNEVCVYKCYLCGKIFNYLSMVQQHLSLHFEREINTYNCALCHASFWFRRQVLQHLRKKHSQEIQLKKSTNSDTDTPDEKESTSNSFAQSNQNENPKCDEISDSSKQQSEALTSGSTEFQELLEYVKILRYRRDSNGMYVCMICRQGFQQEQSLLKHIKLHSNHNWSYCKQCGHGFTEYSLLQQHLKQCSESNTVQYPAILKSDSTLPSYELPDKNSTTKPATATPHTSNSHSNQFDGLKLNRETTISPLSENSSRPPLTMPFTITDAVLFTPSSTPSAEPVSDDTRSSLLSHLLKKTTECNKGNESMFTNLQKHDGREDSQEEGVKGNSQEEMARALLEQEGIKEDVTVVMPCDPEDVSMEVEEETPYSPKEDDWSESADTRDSQTSAEILTAPKRSLMSNLSSKSRRKTSQPMRINHDTEIAASSLLRLNEEPLILPKEKKQDVKAEELPTIVSPSSEASTEASPSSVKSKLVTSSVAVVNPALNSVLMSQSAIDKNPTPTTSSTPANITSSTIPQQNPHFPLFSSSAQLAQAIAAAGAHAKNMTPFLGNLSGQSLVNSGKLSSLAQTLARAGHFPPSVLQSLSIPAAQSFFSGQVPASLAQSLNGSAAQALLASGHLVSPLTQALALQATAALHAQINKDLSALGTSDLDNRKIETNSNEQQATRPGSLNAPHQSALLAAGAPANLALFPGIPAANFGISPDAAVPISVQVSSPESSSKSKDPSPSPQSVSTTYSDKSSAEPSPVDSRDQLVGYPRVQWSPSDSAAGLSNFTWSQISTDGRKVTSLSRTHSRLPIINTPVNREQICKPTTLEDGRQVFRCPFCSKDFLSYSDINRHMDFHEDIRPYKCKYCEYFARTNSQLKVHMMRHQGIREFCCKVCNYKGVTQSDLNRHMKSQIHMLKSRNECSYCGEGFVTTKNLEKHLDGNCIVKVQQEKGEYLC